MSHVTRRVTDKKKEQEEEEVAIVEVHKPVKSRICFEVKELSLETHCSIILMFN